MPSVTVETECMRIVQIESRCDNHASNLDFNLLGFHVMIDRFYFACVITSLACDEIIAVIDAVFPVDCVNLWNCLSEWDMNDLPSMKTFVEFIGHRAGTIFRA